MVKRLVLLLLLAPSLATCVERSTTVLADFPQLPQGAGSVSIDMTGVWEIQEALPVSAGFGSELGPENPGGVQTLGAGSGDSLQRFLAIFRIGSDLEIRDARFDSAEGLSLAEAEISSPERVNKRYLNQATDRFAVLHVIQESKPHVEPVASLTFWLLTGAVASDRMLGRVTVQVHEAPREIDLDWWIGLRRTGR